MTNLISSGNFYNYSDRVSGKRANANFKAKDKFDEKYIKYGGSPNLPHKKIKKRRAETEQRQINWPLAIFSAIMIFDSVSRAPLPVVAKKSAIKCAQKVIDSIPKDFNQINSTNTNNADIDLKHSDFSLKNEDAFANLLGRNPIESRNISATDPGSGKTISVECPTLVNMSTNSSKATVMNNFHRQTRLTVAQRLPDLSNDRYNRSSPAYPNSSGSVRGFGDERLNLTTKDDHAAAEEVSRMATEFMKEAKASGVDKNFADEMDKISLNSKGTFTAGPNGPGDRSCLTKSEASIRIKAHRMISYQASSGNVYLNPVRSMDDLVRGTIHVESYKDMANVVTELKNKYPNVKFDNKYKDVPYEGYVGIHAYVPLEYTNGKGDKCTILAELQIHTKAEKAIEHISHQAYNVGRVAVPGSDDQKRSFIVDSILYTDAMITGLE